MILKTLFFVLMLSIIVAALGYIPFSSTLLVLITMIAYQIAFIGGER